MTSEQINEARRMKREEDLKFVEKSINDGLTITQIRQLKPEFGYNEVTPMIKALINEGIITQEKVDENRVNGAVKTMNKGVEMSPEEQTQFILEKMKEGYTPVEIVESDKTGSITLHKVGYQKRKLVLKGIVSEEEINNAMKKRQERELQRKHQEVINIIRKYIELGYSLVEISELIPEYNYSYLSYIKSKYAKENGWYTNEELKKFAYLRKVRESEEAQRVFDNLPPEEKKRIEEERIEEQRRTKEEKRRKQEEIIKRRQAKKDETTRKHQEDAKILKEQIKSGKTMKEISEFMQMSLGYLYEIRGECIENNIWFTPEELILVEEERERRKERKSKEREKQKKEEESRQKKEKVKEIKENQLRIKKEVSKFRDYVKKGYTYKEISNIMGYSISYLLGLRKLAIADNIWFTNDAIAEFKQLRKGREAFEQERKNREREAKLKRERRKKERAFKEEQKIINDFDKKRKRKIREYSEKYKRYKKAAKKEDKLELEGEQDVSTEGRMKFIETLVDLHNLDADMSNEDIELTFNTIYLYPELANKNNIKFLISDANKKGGLKSAEKMAIELANTLRNTRFYKPLVEYRIWIKKQALLPIIKEMKKQGMNNSNIAERIGISSAEVSIIFNNDKPLEFSDFEERDSK